MSISEQPRAQTSPLQQTLLQTEGLQQDAPASWLLVQIHLFIAVSVERAGGEFPFLGGCGCSFKQTVAAQAWLVQGLDAHAEVAQGGRCCQELPSKL